MGKEHIFCNVYFVRRKFFQHFCFSFNSAKKSLYNGLDNGIAIRK